MKKTVFILLLLLIAVSLIGFALQSGAERQIGFSLEIMANEGLEVIAGWKQDDDDYYFFLPSYADLSQTKVRLLTDQKIYVDGILLTDGLSCELFQLNVPYQGICTAWGRKNNNTHITFIQSANVPVVHIDTESGSMDYIHAQKGNEEKGKLRLYAADGILMYSGEIETINGRGNATWVDFAKKPYSIQLHEEANLLGMDSAQKWILLANAHDPSNLRNKAVLEFAEDAGMRYTPQAEWVDVYLNGEYAGLYLLSERNEVHEARVDIAAEDSFLVSMELRDRIESEGHPYVSTDALQTLRIRWPQDGDETSKEKIKSRFQIVENAILAEDGIDTVTGKHFTELIDIDSWVMKYLIDEVFANVDACVISQFFYLDGNDDKEMIYAGPAWDYDLSMGNEFMWQCLYPAAIHANRLEVSDIYSTPWFHALYQKKEFNDLMTETYSEKVVPILNELVNERLAAYVKKIAQASRMNQIRWGVEADIETEMEHISEFLNKRIEFLTSLWVDGKTFYIVKANPGNNRFYGYHAVSHGENLLSIPTFNNNEFQNFLGWYYSDTDEPFDVTAPIYEDTEIYAKWVDSESNKLNQIIKLIPLAAIALLGFGLLTVEMRRRRKVCK